jgi:2-amino-4-hydroxy-6-hydroxymethyldihydropteridine diphosphokinase
MHERRFVLKPLSDISPNMVHPVLKKSVAQLLKELEDSEQKIVLYK